MLIKNKIIKIIFFVISILSLNLNIYAEEFNISATEIIVDKLAVDESQVSPGANYAEDLDADSLDTVELVMALEEEFEIDIPDEAAEKISTVRSAVDFIVDAKAWYFFKITKFKE